MAISAGVSYLDRSQLYFHRIREGENTEQVATRFNVDLNRVKAENPGLKDEPGEIIVINFG